jgi:hypothetical protein
VRTTNFDALAASAPLDRQASTVRDGSGDLWTPNVKVACAHWDAPPPAEKPLPSGQEDRAGQRFGRFTVVRYHTSSKATGSKWLVRCACGEYEIRSSKAVKNPANTDDCCTLCRHLVYLQRRDRQKLTPAGRRDEEGRLDAIAAKARAA